MLAKAVHLQQKRKVVEEDKGNHFEGGFYTCGGPKMVPFQLLMSRSAPSSRP